MQFNLSHEEKKILLKTARIAIKSHLDNKVAKFPASTENLNTLCGAFVTLHKNNQLRGCIGYVQAIKPLIETVKDVAVSSAFNDPRFPPLNQSEYGELEIEISVLTPLKKIKDIDEIEVGVHGIMIRRGIYSGLLLPQVATEYGWDRDTFLMHTCRKAGMAGDCWKHPDTVIEIFSGIIFNEKEIFKKK